MEKGIFYVTEATVSMVLLGIVIIGCSVQGSEKPAEMVNELYITQCLHDVLKCRFAERDFSLSKMEADFRELFPNRNGFVEVNGARVRIGREGKNAICVNAVHYSAYLGRSELRVLVYTG